MASVGSVLVQPDPFRGMQSSLANFIPSPLDHPVDRSGNAALSLDVEARVLRDISSAPRPVNGITVKPNTPAFAQVISSKTRQPLAVINGMGGSRDEGGGTVRDERSVLAWTAWLLQSVREERVEKTQLVETFGESYLYAFGERPRTLMFQGLLLNTEDYNWRAVFWENWDQHFRASKLTERAARMYISFDDILVEGYPINASANQVADSPSVMVFSFTFFVTNYTSLTKSATFQKDRRLNVTNVPTRTADFTPIPEIQAERRNQYLLRQLGRNGIRTAAGEAGLAVAASGGAPWAANLAEMLVENTGNLALDVAFNAGDVTALNQAVAFDAARLAQNLSRYLLKAGIEKTGLSESDFNAWYGHLSYLLKTAITRGPNFFGGQLGEVRNALDGPLGSFILAGSTDRLIQQMGYAVEAGLRGRPYASIGPSFKSAVLPVGNARSLASQEVANEALRTAPVSGG